MLPPMVRVGIGRGVMGAGDVSGATFPGPVFELPLLAHEARSNATSKRPRNRIVGLIFIIRFSGKARHFYPPPRVPIGRAIPGGGDEGVTDGAVFAGAVEGEESVEVQAPSQPAKSVTTPRKIAERRFIRLAPF